MVAINFTILFLILVSFCTITIFVTSVTSYPATNNNPNKILLSDVQVLTFQRNMYTTGRRNPPIPQLNCVGGNAKHDANNIVHTIQCRNTGFDGSDYNWECKSAIDDHHQLGKTQVSCEGYDYPDDEYILKGSCGIEYELLYTQKYYDHRQHNLNNLINRPNTLNTYPNIRPNTYPNTHPIYHTTNNNNIDVLYLLVLFAIVGIAFLISNK
jgi:hypothetical protein